MTAAPHDARVLRIRQVPLWVGQAPQCGSTYRGRKTMDMILPECRSRYNGTPQNPSSGFATPTNRCVPMTLPASSAAARGDDRIRNSTSTDNSPFGTSGSTANTDTTDHSMTGTRNATAHNPPAPESMNLLSEALHIRFRTHPLLLPACSERRSAALFYQMGDLHALADDSAV